MINIFVLEYWKYDDDAEILFDAWKKQEYFMTYECTTL